jgi:CubicO group peptidase (beta-lactamase class C family)
MKRKLCWLIACIISLGVNSNVYAQNTGEIDAVLNRYAKDLGEHFVVLVHQDGKELYKHLHGEMKLESQEPIVHSSSWLAAAMVMILVDEGKIQLDDPVAQYLPIFSSYSKSYITIRHCLSNTTGIDYDAKMSKLISKKKYENLEEEVNDIASKRDIKAKPGEQFYYGTVGITIAARICEVVTKKTFERLIQEKLLRPMAIRKTNFQTDGMSAVNPATGGNSSALDYVRFMSMLLNQGNANGKQILSPASAAELLKIQTNAPSKYTPTALTGFSYGFGNWTDNSEGQTNIVCAPSLTGTWAYVDKDKKRAAIIFTRKVVDSDLKRNMYQQIRETIDQVFPK